jgi:hypothetical protein
MPAADMGSFDSRKSQKMCRRKAQAKKKARGKRHAEKTATERKQAKKAKPR